MQKPMKLLHGANAFAKKRKEVDIPKKAASPKEVDLDGKRRRLPVKKGLPSTTEEHAFDGQSPQYLSEREMQDASESRSEHVEVSPVVTGGQKQRKGAPSEKVGSPSSSCQHDSGGAPEKTQLAGKFAGKQKKAKTPVHERVSMARTTRHGVQKGKPSS